MKTIASITTIVLSCACLTAAPLLPPDTTFVYNNHQIVINDDSDKINVKIYRNDENGTVESRKIYESVHTDAVSIERQYESRFEIFVPDILKPKKCRNDIRAHWAGFGVGFARLPEGTNFNGELSSALISRSLQYNLNFSEMHWRMGESNFAGIVGIGIQFNSIHLQTNKAIEVHNNQSVITTTEPGQEYSTSRLHYTYFTFPFLIETNVHLTNSSHLFINAGVVGKVRTASSSKIWTQNKDMQKMPGDLNLRPITFDFLVQAGVDSFGFFASYSPVSLFFDNKGPKGNQATLGLQLYF